MARIYGLLARTGSLNLSEAQWERAFTDPTMTDRERSIFRTLVREYRFQSPSAGLPSQPGRTIQKYPVAPRFVLTALTAAGLTDTCENRKVVLSVMASAYQQALLQANDELASGSVAQWLPHLPEAMIDQLTPPPPLPNMTSSIAPELSSAVSKDRQAGQARAINDAVTSSPTLGLGMIDLRMSEIAKLAIETHTASGDWQASAQRNAKVIADIFIAENGDLRMSEIEPKHVIAVRRRLEIMPTIWGKSTEDHVGGLASVFARGEALKAKWDAAKSDEDKRGLPKIGFSAPTINRHMLTLKQQFDFVRDLDDGDGNKTHVAPRASFAKLTVKDRRKKNSRKPVPASHEMHQLLSSPLHMGCAGPEDRFHEGGIIIHDSGYWMVLILAVYGSRSNEFCQLPLGHVFDKEPIPFFRIQGGDDRTVKTAATNRDLPIAPKFLELGFIDYIQALRDRGETWLFPELNTTREPPRKVFMDDVFRPLMQSLFPKGTSAKMGEKDIDTQSFRKFLTTFLRKGSAKIDTGIRQAFFGHERDTTLEGTYEDDPSVEELLPCVLRTQELIAHLQPSTLRLR